MKLWRKILTLVCSLSLLLPVTLMTGCTDKSGISKDPKTINVQLISAGYGTSWVREVAGYFEDAYKDEGYKVNILYPSSDLRGTVVINELALGYKETSVDLYITEGVLPDKVGQDSGYGALVEELDELVYDQKPIGYDGKEEDKTVRSKLSDEMVGFMTDSYGKLYAMPYINTAAGMVVNTKKLKSYGLELPKTTNEMLDVFEKIYLGTNGIENSTKSGVYPVTYYPSGNGYLNPFIVTMLAQYDLDSFYRFMSMQEKQADGTYTDMVSNGYEVFNAPSLHEALTVAYQGFDAKILSDGTTNQSLDQSQAQIMRPGGAVFMCNGDWMLNEVSGNYKNTLSDIDFINFPVISALGVKLFGTGTSHALSDDECDKLLRYIIDLVDEKKDAVQIVEAVSANKSITITEDEAKSVMTARNIYYDRGNEHQIYITKNSSKKDIAALFMRMIASDDCVETIAKFANANSAFLSTENNITQYEFVKHSSQVVSSEDALIVRWQVSGYRQKLQLSNMFPTITSIPTKIAANSNSIYNKGTKVSGKTATVYREVAYETFGNEYRNAETQWNNWKRAAGLN